MSKDKASIARGIQFMAIAILLMFLGPVLLSIGFRALKDGIYLWSIIGGIISFAAIVMAFLGIKTIIKGLFDNE